MEREDPGDATGTEPSERGEGAAPPPEVPALPDQPPEENGSPEPAQPSASPQSPHDVTEAAGAAEPSAFAVEPSSFEAPAVPPEQGSLAAIRFKAEDADLPVDVAAPAPTMTHSRLGDLPVSLAIPAATISLGFGLVLLGVLLPMSQTSGRHPLLAIESVAGGTTPNSGYWFGLGAAIAGFVSQLIAYPLLAKRGRALMWVLLLLAIGAVETTGFAIARRSGVAVSGDVLIAVPPVLGIGGGVVTALAGLALGLVGRVRDGVRCRECHAVLARESGFCPDCGASLAQSIPVTSRLASTWGSGFARWALGVLVVAIAIAGVAVLVLETVPQT